MLSVFSGAIAFEYSQEGNNYGIVEIKEGERHVQYLPDYYNLRLALKKALRQRRPRKVDSNELFVGELTW